MSIYRINTLLVHKIALRHTASEVILFPLLVVPYYGKTPQSTSEDIMCHSPTSDYFGPVVPSCSTASGSGWDTFNRSPEDETAAFSWLSNKFRISDKRASGNVDDRATLIIRTVKTMKKINKIPHRPCVEVATIRTSAVPFLYLRNSMNRWPC